MPAVPYLPDAPDLQTVRLVVDDVGPNSPGINLRDWVSYDFASDFLTPTDGFSFTLADDELGLPSDVRAALKIGARVRLYVEDFALASGYIDSVEVSADRSGGSSWSIHGRDGLGQTLDAVADPRFQLKEGGTLAELLKRLFAPFGWSADSQFLIDDSANRDAKKGKRGIKTRKTSGKRKSKRALSHFRLHQTKPYNHESVFHFASRVAQRHGLWIWVSADGSKLIVDTPDFDQEPDFTLLRGRDGRGNILSGTVKYDMTDMPSILMADSYSGGGEFGRGSSKSYCVNPMLGMTDDASFTQPVQDLLKKYPGAVEVTIPQASFPFRTDLAKIPFRPMFLHDDESKTQDQLNNFVRREMSLLYRKALTAHYVVEGHGQTLDSDSGSSGFIAWAPNTVVDVLDDIAELRERMYVLGVHFSKQRGGSGTTTRLDLVRLNSLVF